MISLHIVDANLHMIQFRILRTIRLGLPDVETLQGRAAQQIVFRRRAYRAELIRAERTTVPPRGVAWQKGMGRSSAN